MKRYPPMKSLLAFEAAARLGSFLQAAAELNVTPGAVGQQIKKLEAWAQMELFIRDVRKVTLTTAGERYYQQICPALRQIAQAGQVLEPTGGKARVAISMPPAFAARWFSPRIPALLRQFPQLDLHLNATSAIVDIERDDIDLAVRYFDGNDMKRDVSLLINDEYRLYCHPDYCRKQRLLSVNDLVNATLLHTTMHPYWPRWLETFTTLSADVAAALPGIYFDQSLLAIDAARRMQGVVLSSSLLLEAELKSGELIELFPYGITSDRGFYLVRAKKRRLSPTVRAVSDWIRAEMEYYRNGSGEIVA